MPEAVALPIWFLAPVLVFMLGQFGAFLVWARNMDQKMTTVLALREVDAKEIDRLREHYHDLAAIVRHHSSKLDQ